MELVPGEGGEDLQDPFSGGGFAVAVLGVERDVVQGGSAHRVADLTLDEGADEQREKLAAELRFDPGCVVE